MQSHSRQGDLNASFDEIKYIESQQLFNGAVAHFSEFNFQFQQELFRCGKRHLHEFQPLAFTNDTANKIKYAIHCN